MVATILRKKYEAKIQGILREMEIDITEMVEGRQPKDRGLFLIYGNLRRIVEVIVPGYEEEEKVFVDRIVGKLTPRGEGN